MTLRKTLAWLPLLLLVACDKPLPPPDPQGKDIVEGAIVAAATNAEPTPGVRMYKVLHVDDYPEPVGYQYHLIVFDPKAPTFEAAREMRARGQLKVINKHIEVRAQDFLPRDHRVIGKEPLSEDELKPYQEARFTQPGGRRLPVPRSSAPGR
jgi:hypothetical protein